MYSRLYLNWIRDASEVQIKEHLAVSHFGSRLYESLQAYMRVSNQLPTSTWVRDSFYSIVYFELMKIEEFIERYYSAGIYDFNLLCSFIELSYRISACSISEGGR